MGRVGRMGRDAPERLPGRGCVEDVSGRVPELAGKDSGEFRVRAGHRSPLPPGVCREAGVGAGRQAGGRECLADCARLPPEPHSVPLSSWQQCPLPCCTQGHDCQHFYPPSDFTVSTQVFRDMKRSHSLQKVGEPWCLEVGLGAE